MASVQMVNDLITITGRLVVLMTKEIEHLRAHHVRDVEALQSEKTALARAYETLIRELRKHPAVLRDLAPAMKEELAVKADEFQRLLIENEAALRAAKDVNQRVIKAIADAVVAGQSSPRSYANLAGRVTERSLRAQATPVSLNRTL
jgi:hypothetical protein